MKIVKILGCLSALALVAGSTWAQGDFSIYAPPEIISIE
jgi:hypothetical protein